MALLTRMTLAKKVRCCECHSVKVLPVRNVTRWEYHSLIATRREGHFLVNIFMKTIIETKVILRDTWPRQQQIAQDQEFAQLLQSRAY